MHFKTIRTILAALCLGVLCAGVSGADISPGDNPAQFRNSQHMTLKQPVADMPPGLPEILPQVSPTYAKTAVFQDILISESVGPANFTQQYGDIAALAGGRMAAVWEDDRMGPVGIYLQIMDNTGAPIGINTALIADDNYDLSRPKICVDNSGNFFVVWREENRGFLQAARFDSLANVLTSVFFISDTLSDGYAGEFDAACLSDGRLIVTWENYASGNDIVVKAFSTAGGLSIPLTTVNSNGSPVSRWSPSVAANPGGDFAVVWEDYRSGSAEIYFRRYNTLGFAYGAEFALGDVSEPDSARYMPSITALPTDGYVTAWVDLREGQNIYYQRVSNAGALTGSNTLLSAETSDYLNWHISLSRSSTGNLLAAWTRYGPENVIMLQRFSSGVLFNGSAIIASDQNDHNRFAPAVAGNAAGNIGLVWTDTGLGSRDLYGAVFSGAGNVVRAAMAINDDDIGSPSTEPVAVAFGNYEWTVVFTDKRRDAGDIMLQRVYVGGELFDGNRIINGDAAGAFQSQPAAAYFNDKLLVSWTDNRETPQFGGQNIFCRFIRPQYNLSADICVNNDSAGSVAHYNSACAANSDDMALVVWTDTRGGLPKIYGQLFGSDMSKQGTNFLIGPANASHLGEMPAVSLADNGDFIVAYLNRLNSSGPAVEVKRITGVGVISNLFLITSDQVDFQIDGFDAAVNPTDEVVIVWHGSGFEGTGLFTTVLDFSGMVTTSTFSIIDNADAMPDIADLAIDNLGYLTITWIDHRFGTPRPFRQIFDAAFAPIQSNTPVNADPGRFMQMPVTAAWKGKGIFVWADARLNGLNIYASQEVYEPTDVDDDTTPLPVSFDLAQNYPNPFNPSTVIRFSLTRPGTARLEIFNLLGQKVRTLVDAAYPAGEHTVSWDGADDNGSIVSSGMYLYRLTADGRCMAKKMTLVK